MATDIQQETHKPGPLKQKNKAHKHGRHRTKGQIETQHKGRVSVKALSRKSRSLDRQQRRNQAKQMRQSKRQDALERKRHIGTETGSPHLVAVIPLSKTCNIKEIMDLCGESDESMEVFQGEGLLNFTSSKHRQRFTMLTPAIGNLYATMDAAKVADTVLFVMGADAVICDFSEKCMACLLAQGLPTTSLIVQGLEGVPLKKRSDVKKKISKIIDRWLPNTKLHSFDNKQDASLVLRHIADQKQRAVFYREQRPYLLGQDMQFIPTEDTNGNFGTLKVSGFLRGKPLDVNRLVNIPGFGDFQMAQIDLTRDPYLSRKKQRKSGKGDIDMDNQNNDMEEDIKIISRANPALQESLDSEVLPDPMEGEQTWPDDDELREAEESAKSPFKVPRVVKKVPKGTSDYQAAWIVDSEGEEEENEDSDEDGDSGEEDMLDMMDSEEESEQGEKQQEEDYETISISTAMPDEKYDEHMDLEEEKKQLEKYKAERENEMFPDEVDTPDDIPAKVRFQRYRGLKSFRTSPWDPKENLPSDYARIFAFENFARTKKRVLKDDSPDGAMPGWYITVHIKSVPKEILEVTEKGDPFVVFGLLPHEQKMTVMHYVLKRHQSFTEPIKSKEILTYHCGYRRFRSGAIFSQHTNGNKFKFERFLPHDSAFVATLYAPILFPPAPVLVFNDKHDLVAMGTVYKADPNRVVAKKIVLSGHPYKINKKKVVVRYMFFNRDDILWFRPVELYTKYGRRGHIREPLGTHGHMKCVFDAQIKAQDTICMSLFKRIYPKWTYESIVIPPPNEDIDNTMEEDSAMT